MTVYELIQALAKLPPDLPVQVTVAGTATYPTLFTTVDMVYQRSTTAVVRVVEPATPRAPEEPPPDAQRRCTLCGQFEDPTTKTPFAPWGDYGTPPRVMLLCLSCSRYAAQRREAVRSLPRPL